jgi:hypothetical protein
MNVILLNISSTELVTKSTCNTVTIKPVEILQMYLFHINKIEIIIILNFSSASSVIPVNNIPWTEYKMFSFGFSVGFYMFCSVIHTGSSLYM